MYPLLKSCQIAWQCPFNLEHGEMYLSSSDPPWSTLGIDNYETIMKIISSQGAIIPQPSPEIVSPASEVFDLSQLRSWRTGHKVLQPGGKIPHPKGSRSPIIRGEGEGHIRNQTTARNIPENRKTARNFVQNRKLKLKPSLTKLWQSSESLFLLLVFVRLDLFYFTEFFLRILLLVQNTS